MKIDFEYEIRELTVEMKLVKGYLECEKVIINNIRKQMEKGFDDENITEFLKKLLNHFGERIIATQQTADCINYRYAKEFVNTLISTPYWHSWIKNMKI